MSHVPLSSSHDRLSVTKAATLALQGPYGDALRYWSGLGAPVAAIASALRRDPAVITADMHRLALEAKPAPAGIVGYPSRATWEDRTVAAILRHGLSRDSRLGQSDDIVVVAGEGALGVAELRNIVGRAAAALRAAGVVKGSRVAVDATQRLESLIVAAATLLLGAVVVRLSLVTGAEGVLGMLKAARPVICLSELAGHPDLLAGANCRLVVLGRGTEGETEDFETWLDAATGDGALPDVCVQPSDLALIGFTSGSTGLPKLVETSHLAVFRSTEAMVAMFDLNPADVFCTSTDFSALSAFRSMLTVPFACGGRVVLPSVQGRTQPLALIAECSAYGVTRLTAIPNVLRGFAMTAGRLPPGSLRDLKTVFSGSGVLDQATRDVVFAACGVPVIDYYGGREFATALYASPADATTVSSGGGVPCNCLIRIVDDAGTVVPVGQVGEIMVHSDCLTASDLAGSHPDWRGWHQSGDLGCVAGSGRVQVVGRRRDVIKAADGSLVFPAEIEALLNEVPVVRESCVLGQIGPDGTEAIVAVVRLADGPALTSPDRGNIAAVLRAHVLVRAGRFRVPHRVVVVATFPRTGTDKIDKTALRMTLATEAASQDLP